MFQYELLVSILLSAIFISILIKFATQLKLTDIPNERSSHVMPTPKGGGIGFVAAALISIAIYDISFISSYIYYISAIVLVLITGIIDDIFEVSPKFKFITIFFAVVLMYQGDCAVTTLGTYFGHEVNIYWLLVFPFTYFAVVGFTNALNLIDGIDGLSSGVSLIILVTLFAIGEKYDDQFIIVVSASFIFSLAAFIFFNWNPARIFMGDSGSLTLGFVIALLSIKSLAYINPTAILLIAAIPLLDTLSVIRRRKQRGQPFFKADKNHLHHILMMQKKDVKFSASVLIMMQFAFSLIGFRSIGQDDMWNIVLFLVLFQIFFSLFDPRLRKRKRKYQKKEHSLHVKMREENSKENN